MTSPWRSLRVQLTVFGFLAIYVPVLVLLGVTVVTEETSVGVGGVEVTEVDSTRSPWTPWTAAALAPIAAGLAWWLAGRAVRPIEQVRLVAEDIEASDLSRRIGLEHGPTELVALAASFDAMLDRLEHAADGQRQLIEEASHELRTPLAVVITNADVLLAHPQPTLDTYRTGLERSRSAATRLQTTIDELLVDARGRARTIDRQPADLMAITRSVVDDAMLVAESKGIHIVITGPTAVICAVDEATVRRALSNLLDNAVRYSLHDSTVDVTVGLADAEAFVVVTDHGPGIADDHQHHVFERFWRGRPDTHGTGLGLPIARHVALAHGGDLTLQSPGTAGDGCAFTITLRRRP